MTVEPGMSASLELVVGAADSAPAFGSGDVPVLATPRLVALVEEAAVAAVALSLPEGATTVGANVSLDHLAASGVGAKVVASAVVEAIEGRRIAFAVEVLDAQRLVARGTHTRVVVDREQFLEGLSE